MFDYTADGVRRSTEDSLQRMGVSRLDIVFVHDISSDNKLLPTPWEKQFAIALKGAFPALSRMRVEGIIEGWGIGVNTPGPILRVFLLAASMVIDDPCWKQPKARFAEFLNDQIPIDRGSMRGRDVLIHILLLPVCLAAAATLIGLIWHLQS